MVLLSFVNNSQLDIICNKLEIKIDYSNGMTFIQKEDVEEVLQRSGNNPLGKKIKSIKVSEMEKTLMSIPEVESANVYRTINGDIGITLTQRTPIVRVFNNYGNSFYIDDKGYQMPLSKNYFPRIPVVTGFVSEPFYDKSVFELIKDSLLKEASLLDEIFAVAKIVNEDPFWSAQIQEIYFNRLKEIELVPVVGQHRIIIGDTSNLIGKFNKLMVFYEKGIEIGGWNKYDTLNLKFKDQIICTRR